MNLDRLIADLCSAVDVDLKLHIAENIRNYHAEDIMRKIDSIVIHCTDTPDYHPSDPAFDSFGVAQVREWHTRPVKEGGRGWSDVGYHYIIRRTGKVEKGRDDKTPGAHCEHFNLQTIGIAYVGREKPTVAQVDALRGLIAKKMDQYKVPVSGIKGHCELNKNKSCPGFNVRDKLLWDLFF